MVKSMGLRKTEIIDRPEVEKKFSLKNPEDKAILIFLPILVLVVIGLIILLVALGGFLFPSNEVSSSLSSLGGSLW